MCCREPFKVYQLDKRATLAPQLTTFHGKKEPGSASIKLQVAVTSIFSKKVEVNFLLRSSIFWKSSTIKFSYHCKYWIPWKEPAEELLIKIGSHTTMGNMDYWIQWNSICTYSLKFDIQLNFEMLMSATTLFHLTWYIREAIYIWRWALHSAFYEDFGKWGNLKFSMVIRHWWK